MVIAMHSIPCSWSIESTLSLEKTLLDKAESITQNLMFRRILEVVTDKQESESESEILMNIHKKMIEEIERRKQLGLHGRVTPCALSEEIRAKLPPELRSKYPEYTSPLYRKALRDFMLFWIVIFLTKSETADREPKSSEDNDCSA